MDESFANQKAHYDTSLTDEYIAAVNRQAEIAHDFRHQQHDNHQETEEASLVKEIHDRGKPPFAFVIRNVLTPAECDELIDDAEEFGIRDGPKVTARTAKRTKDYRNADLSVKVEERIRHILDSQFQDPSIRDVSDPRGQESGDAKADGGANSSGDSSQYMGPFYGVHNNWRIIRYDTDSGNAFPAHQDQMDSIQKPRDDGSGRKDFLVSSHTLLIQLSQDGLEGGHTRFYPRAKIRLPSATSSSSSSFRKRQFDHAVDVVLPRGWALVFVQRGLMHAGQPLGASSPCHKYVAQAGLLRVLPEGVLQRPSVFKNGPGVTNGAF